MSSSQSPLLALSAIISSGILEIQAKYDTHGVPVPSLDEPFRPVTAFNEMELAQTAALVIGAAQQVIAMLTPPPLVVIEHGMGAHTSAMLAVATQKHMTEILREAGPQGLHVRDLGKQLNMDPQKIGRVLRCLATQHIFREVSPDVFTNNRLSSIMDTGKSYSELQKNPMAAYDNPQGVAAFIGHTTEEVCKASYSIPEFLTNPSTAFSDEETPSPFSMAFHTSRNVWEWFEAPGNERSQKRFTAAMTSVSRMTELNIIPVIDWNFLGSGAIVVDVGGGVGHAMLPLAKEFPDLKFIIQDRVDPISEAQKYWPKELPGALEDGRVTPMVHDFFTAQPIKDASVFFVRFVLHDWANKYAKKIMTHLAAAAQPHTKLIVGENILPYACPADDSFDHIPGAKVPLPPAPLLPNLGSGFFYKLDAQMLTFNASERTVGDWVRLAEGTGWKLTSIKRGLGHPTFAGLIYELN